MNAETRKMAALASLCLQYNALIPVTETEILEALHAMERALEQMLARDSDAATAQHDLLQAGYALGCLLYNLGSKACCIPVKQRKLLESRINQLRSKLSKALTLFCQVKALDDCALLAHKQLLKMLAGICGQVLQSGQENDLCRLIHAEITLLPASDSLLPYHRRLWWSQFAAAASAIDITDTALLQGILTALNFNTPAFIDYLYKGMESELEAAPTVAGKLEFLTASILKYTLLRHQHKGYLPFEKSLQQVLLLKLQLHSECLKVFPAAWDAPAKLPAARLQTALSVPQLALLVRLLVDARIIQENSQQALLQQVAGVVSTTKAAAVSAKSLRVNYYAPNMAAKAIMQSYLAEMMKLLRAY